jgi:hypothetical protein
MSFLHVLTVTCPHSPAKHSGHISAYIRRLPLYSHPAEVKTRPQSPTFYRIFTLAINYLEEIAIQLNQAFPRIKRFMGAFI